MLGHHTWFLSLRVVDAFVVELPAADCKTGIGNGDLFRRVLVLRVLSRWLSFHDTRYNLHTSLCIRSTSVDILSFVDTPYRQIADTHIPARCHTRERIIMKGGLTILYLIYPTLRSLKLPFISAYILLLHFNIY
jgi:hypothetical protein